MRISYSGGKAQTSPARRRKKIRNHIIKLLYPKPLNGQRGFTILEFLLALFLSSLLVLLVYQVYHQVLTAYKRPDTFSRWWVLTESLSRQLEARFCEPVPFRGGRPLFLFEKRVLIFLTDFAPGGQLLVAYGPWPDDPDHSFYWEIPYTGWRLPDNPDDLLEEHRDEFYRLPRFKFQLFEQKDDQEEAVEEIRPGHLYRLEILTKDGFKRSLYFLSCP